MANDDKENDDDIFKEHEAPPGDIPVGSEAIGVDPKGDPVGSEAVGGEDAEFPLRGALLFGNDPEGDPRGSEAVGGEDVKDPLRGALLFGNDPKGDPRGSEAVGEADTAFPLRGALLFGNDPDGQGRGSEAFGNPDTRFPYRGSEAFGAGTLPPRAFRKDNVGYDFGGVILVANEFSLSGIRKAPVDRLRERMVSALQRTIGTEVSRLRQGLRESSIPWGKLKRPEAGLDKDVAYALRKAYNKAPGQMLGIDQSRRVLESLGRMHTFTLQCEWDHAPMVLRILKEGKPVAFARTAYHLKHRYWVFMSPKKKPLAYVDTLRPRTERQRARIRDQTGETVAWLHLTTPTPDFALEDDAGKKKAIRFEATVYDADDKAALLVKEQRTSSDHFLAHVLDPTTEERVGTVEDRLKDGKIRSFVELDVHMHRAVAWGLAAVMSQLARLRRSGWPDAPEVPDTKPLRFRPDTTEGEGYHTPAQGVAAPPAYGGGPGDVGPTDAELNFDAYSDFDFAPPEGAPALPAPDANMVGEADGDLDDFDFDNFDWGDYPDDEDFYGE